MRLRLNYFPYELNFTFRAGTSRGVMSDKLSWMLVLQDAAQPQVQGWGEAGPLPGLSPDADADLAEILAGIQKHIEGISLPADEESCLDLASELVRPEYPSVRFALETALLDLLHGGKREIIPGPFNASGRKIPINGLIWMGNEDFMISQFSEKLNKGFSCYKMKIGAISFESELRILRMIREQTDAVLRVDANGAFDESNVFKRLNDLQPLDIHSIEQPVKPGQHSLMARICRESPVPVALDEELIGINDVSEKINLLENIKPAYIILKPTLVGGIRSTREWIRLAEGLGIGWWMTSALESNIGLNAICQLTDSLDFKGHQGLGTGQLYHNNIESPLVVSDGQIGYYAEKQWELPEITQYEPKS